eukprot:CAMPEP_0197487168 /NCGR_PEP_ID=MMETSP1311-20131121/2190_1 /TAXON_ID=464262 /ORGANISM="Genus nov. species nov., Strain RCC856" /LENGTH=114 /DNA_ID=CAMNT_0043030705 /DNA_START=122 /DNA_END=466 /DNA_ORIENTATION=-
MNANVTTRMNVAVGARQAAVALPARRTLRVSATKGVRATRKATVMSAKLGQQEKFQAAFLLGAAPAMAYVPAAEAAEVSPSLKNLLLSVLAGGAVLTFFAVSLSTVSRIYKIDR